MTINLNNNLDNNLNLNGGFEPRRIHLSKIEKKQGFLPRFEWHFSPTGEKKYYIDYCLLSFSENPKGKNLSRRKRERNKPRHRG